jgi:hypothetical protein
MGGQKNQNKGGGKEKRLRNLDVKRTTKILEQINLFLFCNHKTLKSKVVL